MTLHAYSYAVLRAVPRVERGEFVNLGIVLYCQQLDYLRTRAAVDADRVRCLDPDANLAAISAAVEGVINACERPHGSNRDGSGLITRFGMLTAPRSTVLQPSPVHVGLTADPDAALDQLLRRLVLPPGREI